MWRDVGNTLGYQRVMYVMGRGGGGDGAGVVDDEAGNRRAAETDRSGAGQVGAGEYHRGGAGRAAGVGRCRGQGWRAAGTHHQDVGGDTGLVQAVIERNGKGVGAGRGR